MRRPEEAREAAKFSGLAKRLKAERAEKDDRLPSDVQDGHRLDCLPSKPSECCVSEVTTTYTGSKSAIVKLLRKRAERERDSIPYAKNRESKALARGRAEGLYNAADVIEKWGSA